MPRTCKPKTPTSGLTNLPSFFACAASGSEYRRTVATTEMNNFGMNSPLSAPIATPLATPVPHPGMPAAAALAASVRTCRQEIHLWPEAYPGVGGEAADAGTPRPMTVAPGPTVLTARPGGLQSIAASAAVDADGVLVEPFRNARHQPRLLVNFPAAVDPLVNGEPALHRVVLKLGDAFQWTPGLTVHVTVFRRPLLGTPPGAQLGRPCPICRVPLAAEASCYTCACGAVFHCEADAEVGLQCAQLSGECPRCRRPIVLEEAYDYTPSQD